MKIKHILLSTCGILVLLASLSGCHTVAGAGQDVADTGQTITSAATGASNSL